MMTALAIPAPSELLVRLRDVLALTAAAAVLTGVLVFRVRGERRRLRGAVVMYCFGLLLLLVARLAQAEAVAIPGGVHTTGVLLATLAFIGLASLVIFDVLLPAIHLGMPRIVRDLCVAFAYIGTAFWLLSKVDGMTLTNLVTTSALVTAVIAFSLQDSLANIVGGLAVQLESAIAVDDWVRIDQLEGRVKEIRWRHTAVETRNWDTVIIPNSVLMKSQVTVLGRRTGAPVQHRMWLYFNVDFRVAPSQVISLVEDALRAEPIEGVAAEPPPNCIAYDFKESYVQYAVRYWLTDLAQDDPTSSRVRVRVYFALKRAGITLSIPANRLFVTEDSREKEVRHEQSELERRLASLRGVELFHGLTEDELQKLAARLRFAPFTAGEAMTRQAAEAHWLYIITRGAGEVIVTGEDQQRKRVALLRAGDFFGEIGLMLGVPRTATVRALEDTECYRLDAEMFRDILHARPEIAENIAHVMARRRVELDAVRENLDSETRRRRLDSAQRDLVARISSFFGLSATAKAGR
jgi:small-conductance mechanosensitive channel/CRP-like cAMP-binding protein